MNRYWPLLVVLLSITSCDQIEKTANELDEASKRITREGENIRKSLEELQRKTARMPKEFSDDIELVIKRGIAVSSAEVRCDTKVIRDQIATDISNISLRIRRRELKPVTPRLCAVPDDQIEWDKRGKTTKLDYFGYAIKKQLITVELVDEHDVPKDVTEFLEMPIQDTHFQLQLWTKQGISPSKTDKRIVFKVDGNVLSTVALATRDLWNPDIKQDPAGIVGEAASDKVYEFSTRIPISDCGDIEQITVWANDVIVGGFEITVDGFLGRLVGSKLATNMQSSTLTLSPGEYITSVSVWLRSHSRPHHGRVNAIQIFTNLRQEGTSVFGGTSGSVNSHNPHVLTPRNGYEVIGFHGRAADPGVLAIGIIEREKNTEDRICART